MKTPPCANNHGRAVSVSKLLRGAVCCVGYSGAPERGAGAGTTRSRGRHNPEQGPHSWGCDSGAGQGASPAGPRASTGSHPRGNPAPPSDAPTCGDATVEPAKARRPPALARLRGRIPEGTLLRPPTRPLAGMRPCRRARGPRMITARLCPAPRSHPSAKADGTCSALRGTWRPISGHLRHACLAVRVIYRLRQSSRNWLGTRLAIIPSPS